MLARTPLYASHLAFGAKMVDFHGWEMPLHYGSQIDEHHAVRQHAGMFDVSHMTILDILGAGDRQFLRKLLTNDVDLLRHNGRALYSCMCNEHGGIIDDLIVYQRASDNYRLILNSASRQRDLAWIQEKSTGFATGLQERHEFAILAIQGPRAIELTMSVLSACQADAVSTLARFESVDVDNWFFARTGYTGEDGLEVILPAHEAANFWSLLSHVGIKPCGLGARDTLRLEAGMMLYGQDMDESTTPLESGLAWTIKWEPNERDFIGMGALLSQKNQGIQRKMVGLILDEKGIMRPGQTVIIKGHPNGVITSGGWSPTLEKSIAFARIPIEASADIKVDIRGKQLPARLSKTKFIHHD